MRKNIINILLAAIILLSGCINEELLNTDNNIVQFSLKNTSEEFFAKINKDTISFTIPIETDITQLTASIKIPYKSEISPEINELTNWSKLNELTITSENGDIQIYKIKILQNFTNEDINITCQKDLDKYKNIETVNGSVTIGKSIGLDSISDLSNLNALKKVKYNLIINSTYKETQLKELCNIEELGGIIINECLIDTINLPKLKLVKTDININNITNLKNISFKQLSYIGGNFKSSNCYKIRDILLPGLTKINKGIHISNNYELKIIDLKKLKAVNDEIHFENLELLGTIKLPSLTNIGKGLYLSRLGFVEFELQNLESIIGSLTIKACRDIEEIDFPNLNSIGNNLVIEYCSELRTLNLPLIEDLNNLSLDTFDELKKLNISKLNTIKNKLYIRQLYRFSDLEAFTSIHSIGLIELNNNNRLTNIDGFRNIKNINSIKFNYNRNLSNFCGFQPEALTNIEEYIIEDNKYNPNLEDLQTGHCSE